MLPPQEPFDSQLDVNPAYSRDIKNTSSFSGKDGMARRKQHVSSVGAVNDGSSRNNSVGRRNTLRRRVSQLKTSTKSLFRRSKGKKEDNMLTQKPEMEDVTDDTNQAVQVLEDHSLPSEVPHDTMIPRPHIVLDTSEMTFFIPLPDSDEDSPSDSPTMPADMMTYYHADQIPSTEQGTLACTTKTTESELSTRLDVDDESCHSSLELNKTPSTSSLPDTPSYFSGSMQYSKIALVVLAVTGFCVVALPHVNRLLRMH